MYTVGDMDTCPHVHPVHRSSLNVFAGSFVMHLLAFAPGSMPEHKQHLQQDNMSISMKAVLWL
jgi:hypothetical protein